MLDKLAIVALTAVSVRYLPRILRRKLPITVGGSVKPGFEDVRDVFRQNFERGLESRESGSAFAVYFKGENVVNIFGGYADADSQQLWRENTLSVVYSTTKAVTAVCIALLADRGLVEYNKPVAHYWPEFAQNGKENITVEQLMEHKAGLPLSPEPFRYDILRDCARCGATFASAAPLWEPGTAHGYHSVSLGPLANELLRRVDPQGRTIGRFFAEEIAKPFGIDFFIGLPLEENHRTAKLIIPDPGPAVALKALKSSRNRRVVARSMRDTYLLKDVTLNAGDLINFKTQNNPEYRAIEIPSANGFGTAEGLAKLLGILATGGTELASGKKLLSRELVDSFLDSEPETMDKVIKLPVSWKRGMIIDYAEDGGKIFGHPGAGGQVAFADPRYQLGFAFTSRCASPFGLGDDPRYLSLQRAMYKCVKRIEGENG
ncbi:beta-lactamase domain-containing protein 2-like [Diadema antillarum]|uniref:beta-lactamase domain-containing protein 2-like n=1 Tax=Diadema antillarum TaxID=105358 RepID=UPI003A85DE04